MLVSLHAYFEMHGQPNIPEKFGKLFLIPSSLYTTVYILIIVYQIIFYTTAINLLPDHVGV
jgi:hypothetical protein